MKLSLGIDEFFHYIYKQLETRFPDGKTEKYWGGVELKKAYLEGLERTDTCFSNISIRGYKDGNGEAVLSHLHMDQLSTFLYYFSNSLWNRAQNSDICSKLVLYNREISGMWVSYKVKLPDIFVFMHPVGTVLGHANYENYLVVLQNVSVNSFFDENGETDLYLGKGLFLGAGAKIIGNKRIGDRVSVGAGVTVNNREIASDMVAYNDNFDNRLVVRKRRHGSCYAQNYYSSVINPEEVE